MNEAQRICGEPIERVKKKVRDHMVPWVQDFIRNSPFAVLASSNANGFCDASPKGGPPGFIKVVNEKRLLIPDISGNRLFQTYENIETNAFLGIVFLVPGMEATSRVNGKVSVLRPGEPQFDEITSEAFSADELESIQQLLVLDVVESYSHCPKSLTQAQIWDTVRIEANRTESPIDPWVPGT